MAVGPQRGQSQRILHIDDDRVHTTIISDFLTSRGYEVRSLTSPRQAMDAVKEGNERVVILDVEMPDISGMELLDQIKSFDGGIQVIMLTHAVRMTNVLQAMRHHALACCFKPIRDGSHLLNAVEMAFSVIDSWWDALEQLKLAKSLDGTSSRQLLASHQN